MKKVSVLIILAVIGIFGSLPADAQYPFGNTTYATPSFVNLNQGAVSFVIGNKAYSGTGNTYNPQEFWEYDPATNAWTRKADFPGANRLRAVAFSIGNKGYIGTGQLLGAGGFAADFWEYDPATNTWTQKASMPEARRSAVGFSIGNKGYVGTGTTASNLYTNDFWEFDPALNTWTQKANFSGIARRGASGFAIGNKGYLGTGLGNTGSFNDFWEYDPAGDAWIQKADFAGAARNAAVSGASSGKGFIGTGTNGASFYGDIYEYNPATNTWASRGGFAQRRDATGFTINGQIYVGLGLTSTSATYLPDFARFSPYWEVRTSTGDYDEANGGDCFLYPLQYTGTFRGYLECTSDNTGCYAGFGINTLQNLGNFCYLSRVEANPVLRGGYGWYGGGIQEDALFCRRNYRATFQNQPASPVGLQFYYTKAEIDDLISTFNTRFGTNKSYSDLVMIKYSGPNQDLDPNNNSSNNSDYQKIVPTLNFYGNAGQYMYAQFDVSSYSEFYLSLTDQRNYYVNDGSQAGDVYTGAIGSNSNNGSPSQPFATINYAISKAQPGDTIYVDAGSYPERLFVNKPLTFKGAYAGVNPGNSLNRGTSETVLLPATEANTVEIVTVQVANITFDGFLFDGDNPSIAGTVTINGSDVNAGMGIFNAQTQSNNLTVTNNIFKNFYRYGVFLFKSTGPVLTGVRISQNRIDNIPRRLAADGRGVAFFSNVYGTISENIITRVSTGVIMANYNLGSTDSVLIASNTIEAYTVGINSTSHSNLTSSITIAGNQITVGDLVAWNAPGSTPVNTSTGLNVGGATSTKNFTLTNNNITGTLSGITVGSINGTGQVTLTDNTVTGTRTGMQLSSINTTNPVLVNGGSISNSTQLGLFYIGNGSATDKLITNNISLSNNVVGMDASAVGGNLQLEFAGVSISGGTTGIRFYGTQLSLPGNIFSGVTFSGQSKEYILQTSKSFMDQTIDASTISFDGVIPLNMTREQLFATEDKLTHKIDFDSVGYFKLKPTEVFITPNSFAADLPPVFGTPTTSPSIKRAIGAAATGDIVRIQSGNYITEDLTLDKALTLSGANELVSPNDPVNPLLSNSARNPESTISGSTMTIAANNITLEGLTFDPGNKSAIVLLNSAGTDNNFGNFNFAKNIYKITNTSAGLNSISIRGKQVTFPAMPVTAGYSVINNRFEKTGTATGTTFNFNFVKDVAITGNSFVVTGTTPKTQTISNIGNSGIVDNYNFQNNTADGAGIVANCTVLSTALISGNTLKNCDRGINVLGSMPQASSIEFSNNFLENTTGGTPFLGYNRGGTSNPNIITEFKVLNNTMIGTRVPGLSNQFFGSMNFTVNNSLLNHSFIIRGNKINYFGDYSSVPSDQVRAVTVRGNIGNLTIAENEIIFNNSGTILPAGGLPANPAITINTEFGSGAFMSSNSVVNILNNKIQNFLQPVVFYDGNTGSGAYTSYIGYGNIPAGAIVNVNNNSFTGDSISINSGDVGEVVNANCNWYGSSAAHNVTPKITETTVDYSPWLSNGTDADLATGFQPVANSCNGVPVDADIILVTNVTCFGAANGTIDAFVEEGVGPFTYAWSKDNVPGFSNNEDLANLAPGLYKLIVTDVNGSIDSVFATITKPELLSASADGTNVSCFNGSNGAVSVSAIGGTAPYTYLWSTTATTTSISNLIAGNYSVTVTDINGCTAVANYTVTQPTLLTVTMTGTTATCVGTATATPAGGTAPYSYNWSNGGTTQTITGVPNGTYTVIVTDANSCTVNGTYTITGNSSINPNAQVVDVTCFGGSNGSITVTGAGGTAPHTYSINGGAYQTSNLFAGLTAGTYTVSAKDATGCFDFVTKTITQPTELLVVQDSVITPCFGVNTGRIFVTASGGSGGKNYNWSGPNGFTSTTQDPSNLVAGTYNLVVTDANGCSASLTVLLGQAPAVSITELVTNVGCRGALTGAINTTVSGGSGVGFTYSWTGPLGFVATVEDINSVAAGNYTFRATDIGNGCVTTKLITITQPAANLSLATTRTNVNGCISGGIITATASGGTAPYQYSLTGVTYQSSGVFQNVSAGNYTVYTKDAGGCIVTRTTAITDNGTDQYESNNSKNQAKLIGLSTVINARIALAADVADWFRFTTGSGGRYLMTFTHPNISYNFKMYPAGNNAPVLVPVDSSATTKEYELAGGTTYYISITGGLSFNCYSLMVAPSVLIGKNSNNETEGITGKTITIRMNASVYPNPHKGSFTLKIASQEEGLALIELFTVSGQKIAAKTVELQKTENNLVPFNSVQPGTIFYRVKMGKQVLTGKVIGTE